MKYLFILSLISCKPVIVDRHDYIITLKNHTIECDYKNSDKSYRRCKDSTGRRIDELYFTEGYVFTIKE